MALFEQDIPIWEHKTTYRSQPLLCNGDGPIQGISKMSQSIIYERAMSKLTREICEG